MEMRFVVPGEPMPWERAEPTIRGGRVSFRTADRTADHEARVRMVAQSARPTGWPMRCRYAVEIDVHRSERGDVDNYTKAVLDAMNPRRARHQGKGSRRRLLRASVPGVLWIDDSRVYQILTQIHDCKPGAGRLVVRVRALPVRCGLKACGKQDTLYPDERGRCEACAARSAARRA